MTWRGRSSARSRLTRRARPRGFRETAHVHLVSLESAEEMPADTIEIVEGDEEGIARSNGWGPTEIVRDENGRVTGVAFRRCLRVYDEDRKFSPLYDDSDTKVIPCDTVLLAVGQAPALVIS